MREVDQVIQEYRKTANRNVFEQAFATAAMCVSCGALGAIIILQLVIHRVI